MRRSILLIFSGLLAFSAMAQPTITEVHNLTFGDKYSVTLIESPTEIIPAEGASINWDYSVVEGIVTADRVTTICVDPANTPFADSTVVKECNVALKPFGTENGTYQFFKVDNNKCELLAIGWYEPGKTSFSTYFNAGTVLTLPFTYGDTFSDQSIMWGFNFQQMDYAMKDTINSQSTAVAFGTIITPAGTFANSLMVKTVSQQHLWLSVGNQQIVSESTVYNWYVPGIKLPVMVITKLSDVPGVIVQYISHTEMDEGGIGDGDGGDNGGGDTGGGEGEPYITAGVWLNTMGTAGDSYAKSVGSLDWTMGEAVIETYVESPEILTQGFCQPSDVITSVVEQGFQNEIKIYPNPFTNEISIDYTDFNKHFDAAIYSTSGQLKKIFTIDRPVTRLQFNNLKPGVYFIRMMPEDGPRSFVVVKK